MKRITMVLLALLFAFPSFAAIKKSSAEEAAKKIRAAAIAKPDDAAAFDAFYRSLGPDDDGFVVVEGDLLMTPDELRRYVQSEASRGERPARRREGELLVDRKNGKDNFYRTTESRRLTYAIDPAGFTDSQLTSIKRSMTDATEEWEGVCPKCKVDFVLAGAEETPFFTVRKHGDGRYLAAAFFPDHPQSRRYVNIDPTFFTTKVSRTGILRHELGHVLGYRHEHIIGVPGCYTESGQWRPLTPYDPQSVMHYFCGGGGSIKLAISDSDRKGHRDLYSLPGSRVSLVEPPTPAESALIDAHMRAVTNPEDTAAVDAFMAGLRRTRDGSYVVVEGDLLMTPDELRRHLARSRPDSERPLNPTGELIVNQLESTDGSGMPRDDIYPPEKRKLRYRIERDSFQSTDKYEMVRENMRQAVAEWQAACENCGISFEHMSSLDRGTPEAGAVNFSVREEDHGGSFIAAAFFPHMPFSRRVMIIDPSYYRTRFDKVGVLRHELGHVLGYRHEHIRGVPECYQEDDAWRPLTPYDPRSVMHYFCGGGGSMALELSDTDREGHSEVYKLASATQHASNQGGELVIRFEGGEVDRNAARVLSSLHSQKLLETKAHVVAPGENIDSILKQELRITPGDELRSFTTRINKSDINWMTLEPGRSVTVPAVRFTEEQKVLRLDPSNEKDAARLRAINTNWKDSWLLDTKGAEPGQLVTLRFRTYQATIPYKTTAEAGKARKAAEKFLEKPLQNTYVYWVPAEKPSASFYSFVSPEEMWRLSTGEPKVDKGVEGDLGRYLSMEERVDAVCDSDCPEVVLMDKPVTAHADLKGALEGVVFADAPLEGDFQIFKQVTFNPNDHGTHLAGIIGSRRNDFGVVGIDPQASIASYPWATLDDNTAGTLVYDRASRTGLQIYVFATEWRYSMELGEPDDRFRTSKLATAIRDSKPLFIAAAGEGPKNLTRTTRTGPMNLGDLPNVLVVTACLDCYSDEAHLHPKANRSAEKIVHVAAPAEEVPSTALTVEYAKSGGTSQAAAFVGGLASAMVRRWPTAYKDNAIKVKERIEVTSHPRLADDCIKKVSAGVVDGKLALINPAVHWMELDGADLKEVSGFSWLKRVLEGRDDRSTQVSVHAQNILRIVAVKLEDNSTRWFVYAKGHDSDSPDRIVRVGPLTLRNPQEALLSIKVTENGAQVTRTYAARDIENLLLSKTVPPPDI